MRDLAFTGGYTRRESTVHYGRTKLMDVMFSQELPFAGFLERALRVLRVGDPRRGAAMITRLAADPEFAGRTGGYFSVKDAEPLPCPEPGRDPEVQRELWEATERLLVTQ